MSAFHHAAVLSVHHWTDTLFSFTCTRDPSFRFQNGQFAMIGLMVDGRPLLRAYSMVSPNWQETLEFLSIKVPDGPLTSRLRHIKAGDTVLVGRKPTGTLLLDNLLPGARLYLLATGTGLAPFMATIRDPETYARFERVILCHTCRIPEEHAYAKLIAHELPAHELVGEDIAAKLTYYPTATRATFRNPGRITDLIRNGTLFTAIGAPPLDPAHDRLMLCGNPDLLREGAQLLDDAGFREGSSSEPGGYVIEKAFVEK